MRSLRPLLCGLPVILSACGATAAGPVLDNAQAAAEIARTLRAREATGYGGNTKPCTEIFDISNVRIVDKRMEGATAQLEAAFVIRSKHRIENGAFASQCYGDLPNGWRVGQTANSRATFRFERWQSGWRLAP